MALTKAPNMARRLNPFSHRPNVTDEVKQEIFTAKGFVHLRLILKKHQISLPISMQNEIQARIVEWRSISTHIFESLAFERVAMINNILFPPHGTEPVKSPSECIVSTMQDWNRRRVGEFFINNICIIAGEEGRKSYQQACADFLRDFKSTQKVSKQLLERIIPLDQVKLTATHPLTTLLLIADNQSLLSNLRQQVGAPILVTDIANIGSARAFDYYTTIAEDRTQSVTVNATQADGRFSHTDTVPFNRQILGKTPRQEPRCDLQLTHNIIYDNSGPGPGYFLTGAAISVQSPIDSNKKISLSSYHVAHEHLNPIADLGLIEQFEVILLNCATYYVNEDSLKNEEQAREENLQKISKHLESLSKIRSMPIKNCPKRRPMPRPRQLM